jgi:murein DD-endopeptidase MepM/ murein hydrolase activator NlpD
MKLIPSNEAINIVEYGLLSLRQTTQGIRKSLGQDIRKDKIREAEKNKLNVQQFDAVQKKDAEKIVEAKQSNNFIKGGVNNIMRGAKSIFQGLLSAAGWILLDYLVQKLPEIIVIVNKVTRIVKKLWDAVQETWKNLQTTFKEIGDVFRQFVDNIKSWDFLDKEGKLKKEFNEFTDSANKLNTDLTDSFGDIMKELKNLSNISKSEFNEARASLGMSPADESDGSSYTIPNAVNLNIPGMMEQFEALQEQLRAGRITQSQYEREVKKLQQTPPPPPKPAAETRPAPEPARPPAGVKPQIPAIPKKLPPLLTKTYPGQSYGAGREGGARRHAGTDFEITGNEEFYSRIGGVVIYARNTGDAGTNGKGYGNVVDIYNKELGVTERIAEARTILVKEGQVVQPGQAVVRGEDLRPDKQPRTGVVHYEIRPGEAGASGKFAGTIDPVKFLRDLGQTVNERYPSMSATDLNKYASLIESPGVEKDYRIAQMPQVIPFDIAMTNLNSKEVLPYGEATLAVVAANAAPELDDSEFKAQRELMMTALASIRQ